MSPAWAPQLREARRRGSRDHPTLLGGERLDLVHDLLRVRVPVGRAEEPGVLEVEGERVSVLVLEVAELRDITSPSEC
jgi:hypothetical protein